MALVYPKRQDFSRNKICEQKRRRPAAWGKAATLCCSLEFSGLSGQNDQAVTQAIAVTGHQPVRFRAV